MALLLLAGLGKEMATATTLVTRFSTLWLGVMVGIVGFYFAQKELLRPGTEVRGGWRLKEDGQAGVCLSTTRSSRGWCLRLVSQPRGPSPGWCSVWYPSRGPSPRLVPASGAPAAVRPCGWCLVWCSHEARPCGCLRLVFQPRGRPCGCLRLVPASGAPPRGPSLRLVPASGIPTTRPVPAVGVACGFLLKIRVRSTLD